LTYAAAMCEWMRGTRWNRRLARAFSWRMFQLRSPLRNRRRDGINIVGNEFADTAGDLYAPSINICDRTSRASCPHKPTWLNCLRLRTACRKPTSGSRPAADDHTEHRRPTRLPSKFRACWPFIRRPSTRAAVVDPADQSP